MKRFSWLMAVFTLPLWGGPIYSQAASSSGDQASSLPDEVVVKGEESRQKVNAVKPPLNLKVDPYNSILPSLTPDRGLFLAQSRMTVGWKRAYPRVSDDPRIIDGWRYVFSERSGIVFNLYRQLQEVLQNTSFSREARKFQWSLTIADEEGRVFQEYSGSKNPPETLIWNGQSSGGAWIQPGRSYSPVYKFIDMAGSPYTRVGRSIQLASTAHPETSGYVVALDSAILFGPEKSSSQPDSSGMSLLRDASDFIKRYYDDVTVVVRTFASNRDLAQSQGESIQSFLARELMLPKNRLTVQPEVAAFPQQRSEIVLLNR